MELKCIPYIISILALVLLLEQVWYVKRKKFLPGPTTFLPFLGNSISLVTNTARFWDLQSDYAKSTSLGVSANYIAGHYIVYISSTELSHKIFANVRPDGFHLILHPFGKKLFGEHNVVSMFGKEHTDARRSMAPNFTPKALQMYTNIQQHIIAKHVATWCDMSCNNSIPLRILCRDMNLETSQTSFVGPYMSKEDQQRFSSDFEVFNLALMKLPIDFPGFAFRNARLARERLVKTLWSCVEQSAKRMEGGGEPVCMVDFWVQENMSEMVNTYQEIGSHLFDFFFAAHDTSTSALLWAVVYMESHPHVLEKVRKEVANYWIPENDAVLLGEHLTKLKYTEAVAREVLRIRSPARVVPHIAGADFPLTEYYTIPKGTIVFPSLFDSSFQGFTEPGKFDPDRFVDERQEGKVYKRNFLAFGAGNHQCVGQRYAMSHLTLFIALFAALVDFKRDRIDGCDELAYVPTTVPKDDCRVFLSPRYK